MVNVLKSFQDWAKLPPEDLDYEIPGLRFDGVNDGILYFTTTDADPIVDLLWNGLGKVTPTTDAYKYPDGTICRFVKTRMWWEFKYHHKPVIRISLR